MKNAHNLSSLGKSPPQFGRLESGLGEEYTNVTFELQVLTCQK